MKRFETMLPGRDISARRDSESRRDPHFQLRAHPSDGYPKLSELLPTTSQVPVPFEATDIRRLWSGSRLAHYVDREWVGGESAAAVYTPTGDIDDQGVHLACRVTLVDEEVQTPAGIAAHYKEKLWDAFDGDPDRELYSDWVTTSRESHPVDGGKRTVFTLRQPRLVTVDLSRTVTRPVDGYAFVLQSTNWGIVETCAYLTPDPKEGRPRELVTTLAETVLNTDCGSDGPEGIGTEGGVPS